MPVLKHARKKLKQDKKRTLRNKTVRNLYRDLIKKAKANPTSEAVSEAVQAVDKAAKQNIIHKNKAARLKSSLAKETEGPTETKAEKKTTTKKTVTKKATKKSTKASSK